MNTSIKMKTDIPNLEITYINKDFTSLNKLVKEIQDITMSYNREDIIYLKKTIIKLSNHKKTEISFAYNDYIINMYYENFKGLTWYKNIIIIKQNKD